MIRLPSLSSLRPRERLFAVGCGAILLVVMLDRLVIAPWTAHRRAVGQEIRQMEEALRHHHRLADRKVRVTAEQARYQRYLRPAVPDDLQVAALVKELQELAGGSGVKLIEIKPLGVQTDDALKRYTVEIRFDGLLEEWVEFVFRVETSPSLYEILRATLTVPEEHPDRVAGVLRVVSAVVNTGSLDVALAK